MLDFNLIHDGKQWIAQRENIRVQADTLPELDKNLAAALKRDRGTDDGNQMTIRMTFDNRVIPQWIRQYSNHYFNRIVTLDLS